MPPKPGISIVDVAKRAGVSKSTVSLVMNEPNRVALAKREAVRRAMRELNFQPRRDKRREVRRRGGDSSHQIALLFPDVHSRGSATLLGGSLVHAFEAALDREGYDLVVTHLRDANHLPRSIESGRVQGVVLRAGYLPPRCAECLSKIPCVTVLGTGMRSVRGDFCGVDNVQVGELAARILIERGHRRLVQIEHYTGAQRNASWAMRYIGFAQTAQEAGAECENWVFDPSSDWPQEAVDRLLSLEVPMTGLFGRGDELIAGLAAVGKSPGQDYEWVHNWPEDIGAFAYADRSFVIDLNFAAQAEEAVALLLDRIQRPETEPRTRLVSPRLRSSISEPARP